MYLNFYDLSHDPFANMTDPDSFFLSRSHKAALQAIIDGIKAEQGLVMLVGEAGLGKTFLLHRYIAQSDPQHVKVIHVFYPKLTFADILAMICWEFGLRDVTSTPERLDNYLQYALLAERKQGRKVVLVIDEAHSIATETLEHLLQLVNLRTSTGEPLCQVILVGLPALWRHINTPVLRPFKKHLSTRLTLSPLTYTESLQYIRQRLLKANANTGTTIFAPGALRQVLRYAHGNPRIINTLCENMLIAGCLARQKPIATQIAQEVIAAYGAESSRALWRWEVGFAAGLLAVASLLWSAQYGHLMFSKAGRRDLPPLARNLSDRFNGDKTYRPIEAVVSPILPEPSRLPIPNVITLSPILSAEPALPLQITALPDTPTSPEPPTPPSIALQTLLQKPSPAVETVRSEPRPRVVAPQPLAVLPTPQRPDGLSKTARVLEDPNKKSRKRTRMAETTPTAPLASTPPSKQDAALPQSPPPFVPSVRANSAPQLLAQKLPPSPETVRPQRRLPAVAPQQHVAVQQQAAVQGPPAPGVSAKTMSATERLNSNDVPKGARDAKPLESRLEDPVRELVATRDSALSAAPDASVPNSTTLWPEGTAPLVVEAGGHTAVIRELIFTADGRALISVSDDKTIRVWTVSPDGRQTTLARTIRGQIGDGRAGMLAAAALSPPDATGRQQWLAVGGILPGTPSERYAIRLHDYASGAVVGLLCGHNDAILALAFSPTGRWLASAGKDGTVRLWDLTLVQPSSLPSATFVLTGHAAHIYDLAWSATGDRLALASYDHTVGLWNTAQLMQGQATLIARLRGHDDQVQTVAFHPSGTVLASGGKDQTIRLWRASDGDALGVFARPKHKVAALAFAPDGQLLLAGNFSPPQPDQLTLFAYPSGKRHLVFTGHQNLVVATAFHPSGHWLASGGGERKEILLWQAQTGEVLSRLEGKGRTIYAVGFSPDGRYLSWGATPHYISHNNQGPLEHRFDLTLLTRLSDGLADISASRALERVGTLALVVEPGGSYGHNARLHVNNGAQRLSTIERGSTDGYRHSAYTLTPDGQNVLSGGLNGVLRLYGLDGTLRAELVGHVGEIKAVAVSADSRWALSGSNDQTLRLWPLTDLPSVGSRTIMPTLTLFPAIDGEWAAWMPDGAFAASRQGARLIGYSINQGLTQVATYIPAEQWHERFYRPEVIQEKLRGVPVQPSQKTVLLHPNK